jgi:catechol 2,3-dioxygenase-like lactoylglutathione lyase family enzyme
MASRRKAAPERAVQMKIRLTSVSISNYDKALKFYTEILGFVKKRDIPLAHGVRWLTLVSPEEPEGTELLLEPNARYPAMKALKESLLRDGIPFTAFQVDDIEQEYARLKKLGVHFTMAPKNVGMTKEAIFNDTCGNLIQIYELNPA